MCCDLLTSKTDGCLEALLDLAMTHQLPLHNDIKKSELKIGEVIGKGTLPKNADSNVFKERQAKYTKGPTKENLSQLSASITATKLTIRSFKKNCRS